MTKLYEKNPPLWEDMLAACREATVSIDLEQFIYVNDEIGRQFIDVCAERAAKGVRVRFLWDDAGSWNFLGSFLIAELSRKNIQAAFFNTWIPRNLDNHRWWFLRNHRRSLIVDGKIAFVGSYSMWKKTADWNEMSLRLEGPIVSTIDKTFEITWERAHGIRPSVRRMRVERKEARDANNEESSFQDGFAYVTNNPLPKRLFLYHRVIEAIRSAQRYIYITTPYFVPDRRIIRVLRLAARRGVDVRIIMPEASDHPIVDLAARTFYTSLQKSGVSIYHHTKDFLHSKVIVIDDEWATVGTMNLDRLSLFYNSEANIVTTNHPLIAELREYCMKQMRSSDRLDSLVWERRGFVQKQLEFWVRFIRKFL